jgi:hypothetical protein
MISKSSSVVTGFNLQTNNTVSGGLISASGISPTYKEIWSTACNCIQQKYEQPNILKELQQFSSL